MDDAIHQATLDNVNEKLHTARTVLRELAMDGVLHLLHPLVSESDIGDVGMDTIRRMDAYVKSKARDALTRIGE